MTTARRVRVQDENKKEEARRLDSTRLDSASRVLPALGGRRAAPRRREEKKRAGGSGAGIFICLMKICTEETHLGNQEVGTYANASNSTRATRRPASLSSALRANGRNFPTRWADIFIKSRFIPRPEWVKHLSGSPLEIPASNVQSNVCASLLRCPPAAK